jgi:hypothetical protein
MMMNSTNLPGYFRLGETHVGIDVGTDYSKLRSGRNQPFGKIIHFPLALPAFTRSGRIFCVTSKNSTLMPSRSKLRNKGLGIRTANMNCNSRKGYSMNKRLVAFLVFFALINSNQAVYAAGSSSLCRNGEHEYFSCTLKNKKTAVVCGGGEGDAIYMQYRFGKPGAVELEFPASRTDSVLQFRLSRYFRAAQGGNDSLATQDLMFTNNGSTYDLGTTEEGSNNGAGIIVTGKDGKSVSLKCVAGWLNIPLELEEQIPCDPEAGVNTARCADPD